MQTRTLAQGQRVFVHQNNGLRKRCGCPRRAWARCSHPWHFSFKWKGTHHRFPLDLHAAGPITDKDTARTEADRLRALIRSGTFPPSTPTPPATPEALTFEAFGEKWLERERTDRSETQRYNDQTKLRRLGALVLDGEPLASRMIGRITEDDIEQAVRALGPLAGSTFNKYRQVICQLQRWGLRKGYLTRPWFRDERDETGKHAVLPRRKGGKRERRLVSDVVDDHGRVTEPGEERRLLTVSSPWLQRLIIAALETCCRRGELLSLQWRDVDLHRGELRIRAENTKDRELRRLPILSRLRAVLELLRLDPAGQPHKPGAHVFGDRIGGRVGSPKKTWESTVLKAHGHTPEWVKGKLSPASRAALRQIDLHFHDLRHEAASRLLEAGWPLQHVQAMCGHADAKTTSIYVNATSYQLADSARRFPGPARPTLHDLAHVASESIGPVSNGDAGMGGKELVN
jgi:integrase